MIMYINGDSHTLGVGVKPDETFAYHIAQHFGAEYINDAKGGGSNDRVLRLTNAYLDNNRPDFLLIGWSTWEREEWVYEGQYYDVNSSGHDELPLVLQDRYKQWVVDISKDWSNTTKRTSLHESIFQLHRRLKNNNIPHLFFNCVMSLQNIKNQYDWGVNYTQPYSDKGVDSNQSCMHEYLAKKGFIPTIKGNHHGVEPNRVWADYLIDYITKHKIL